MGTIIAIIVVFLILSFSVSNWNKWATKKVSYKRYLDVDRVFPGDKIRITTEIINRKLLLLPWIEVHAEIPNELNFQDQKVTSRNKKSKKIYKVVTSLFSFQKVKRHNTLYCDKRGYYPLYDVKISIGDYLGLNVAEKTFYYPIELVVYPEIKPLESLVLPYKDPQGEVSVKRWIIPDTMEVVGAREYTSRDSFNTIDWKATAKTNNLYVKKFDYTANPSVMLLLNVQTHKLYWQSVDTDWIEKGIEIAAAITQKAMDEKIPIGYTSNCVFNGKDQEILIEARMQPKQKMLILEALAKTSYYRRMTIEELFKNSLHFIPKGSVIVLMTAFISEDLRKEINYLAKRGYTIKVIVLDPYYKVNGLHKNIEVIFSNDSSVLAV